MTKKLFTLFIKIFGKKVMGYDKGLIDNTVYTVGYQVFGKLYVTECIVYEK